MLSVPGVRLGLVSVERGVDGHGVISWCLSSEESTGTGSNSNGLFQARGPGGRRGIGSARGFLCRRGYCAGIRKPR
jgi:hypothetical protein